MVDGEQVALEDLRGVGPVTAMRLRAAGIGAPADLRLWFPRAFREYAVRQALGAADLGRLVEVQVRCEKAWMRRGRVPCCEARFELVDAVATNAGDEAHAAPAAPVGSDGSDGADEAAASEAVGPRRIEARFFGNRHLATKLSSGGVWRLRGRVAALGKKSFRIEAAEVAVARDGDGAPLPELRIEPVYPRVPGIPAKTLRGAIHDALDREAGSALDDGFEDEALLARLGLPPLRVALREIHAPSFDVVRLEQARRRVALLEARKALDEVRQRRERWREKRAWPLVADERVRERVRARLPFRPSAEQERCIAAILADLGREQPMARLLQGDVGSGKTLIAMATALVAAAAKKQTVLLAPTTMLADQHVRRFSESLAGSRLPVLRFTQGMTRRERGEALARFKSGEPCIAIGTHALLSEDVDFTALALLIIDEQQRFGVRQRGQLFDDAHGRYPHVLVMSATPIPRSYANALFGDLDSSELRGHPTPRAPVRTTVHGSEVWPALRAAIASEVARGGRVYVVCPRIGRAPDDLGDDLGDDLADDEADGRSNELDDPKAAIATHADLSRVLPTVLVHGRQDRREQQRAYAAFRNGEVGCLVATTVVEVGIDVPEATWMVVRDAERLGLSQLHQLRGRVGRGGRHGRCLLLSDAASERLRLLESCNDGFEIAEADWRMRGSGELTGRLQHGHERFRCLDLGRDLDLLELALD